MNKLITILFLLATIICNAQYVSLSPRQINGRTYSSLVDGTTISWDVNTGFDKTVTLGGNRTLSISNAMSGDYGTLIVTQDGTGSRTLAVPNATIALNPIGGTSTVLGFTYDGSTFYWSIGYISYLDTIYRTIGKDSLQFTINGRYHAILDSAGGGASGITIGTTAITSGTANRLLYENSSHIVSENANGFFDGTNAIFGGGSSNGSYSLQTNAGLYAFNGDNFFNGNTGHTWEAVNFTTLNFHRSASGDQVVNFVTDNAGTWSHILMKAGNGTGAPFATVDLWYNGATSQKWYMGPYGTPDFWIQDITASTQPFVLKAGTLNAGIGGVTTPTAKVHIGAGTSTASTAPLKFTSGTNLTSAEAGAVEYDGVQFYHTIDVTSGRGAVPTEQYFHLTADGGAITTIGNFFGSTSNINIVASAYYEIEMNLWFTTTGTGTVTFTFTNSAAPTSQNIFVTESPAGGLVTGTPTATILNAEILNDATSARTIVTPSLTAGDHYVRVLVYLKNGTGTTFKIQATAGGTNVTPRIGSWWKCIRRSPNNIGTFAN